MANGTPLLTDPSIHILAVELYNASVAAEALEPEHAALTKSLGLIREYDDYSATWMRDTYWGQSVTWPDEEVLGEKVHELLIQCDNISTQISTNSRIATKALTKLREVLVDQHVEVPVPLVPYSPERRSVFGISRLAERSDPFEGRIVAVSREGRIPPRHESGYHGSDLPAVTIKHRLGRYALKPVYSTIPLIVFDQQEVLLPNFV